MSLIVIGVGPIKSELTRQTAMMETVGIGNFAPIHRPALKTVLLMVSLLSKIVILIMLLVMGVINLN